MQKPCKNNFHRVLIVGGYIVAQIVVFLNLCYNKDVALEHQVVFLSDVRQTARKGSLFLHKKALTNCEGSEGKTWKKGFCFLVEVIGE